MAVTGNRLRVAAAILGAANIAKRKECSVFPCSENYVPHKRFCGSETSHI